MTSNPTSGFKIIDIKEEAELIYNQPVVVQNAHYIHDFDQTSAIKAEPEENYCMEVEEQPEYLHNSLNNDGNQLKIQAVTQRYYDIFKNQETDFKSMNLEGKIQKVTKKSIMSSKTSKVATKASISTVKTSKSIVEYLKIPISPSKTKTIQNSSPVAIKAENWVENSPISTQSLQYSIVNIGNLSQKGQSTQNLVPSIQNIHSPRQNSPHNLQNSTKIRKSQRKSASNLQNLNYKIINLKGPDQTENLITNIQQSQFPSNLIQNSSEYLQNSAKSLKRPRKSATDLQNVNYSIINLQNSDQTEQFSQNSAKKPKISRKSGNNHNLELNLHNFDQSRGSPIKNYQNFNQQSSLSLKTSPNLRNLLIDPQKRAANLQILQKSSTNQQTSQKNIRKPKKSAAKVQKSSNLQCSSLNTVTSLQNLKDPIEKSKTAQNIPEGKEKNPKPKKPIKIKIKLPKKSQPENPVKQESLELPNNIQIVDYDQKPPKKRKEIVCECDHCGKIFKSKYSIIWHMKEHMLTMPFNCNICGKGFSYERSYKQHELSHAAKVKCEICKKQLKPHAMYYHMKYRHTNEKTHQCPMCPKKFKTKDNISRHMMRHNMDFECHICKRRFAENSRLMMHIAMHERPEDFYCNLCGKTFEHIDRHVKRLHTKTRERNLKCKYCEYASDSKQTVRRHEEMHEKRNEIMQLKATKKRKERLKVMELKQFECKVCNVVLQTKSGYKSHLRHYHKGKDAGKVEILELKPVGDKISMRNDKFVEVKVESDEVSVIQ